MGLIQGTRIQGTYLYIIINIYIYIGYLLIWRVGPKSLQMVEQDPCPIFGSKMVGCLGRNLRDRVYGDYPSWRQVFTILIALLFVWQISTQKKMLLQRKTTPFHISRRNANFTKYPCCGLLCGGCCVSVQIIRFAVVVQLFASSWICISETNWM